MRADRATRHTRSALYTLQAIQRPAHIPALFTLPSMLPRIDSHVCSRDRERPPNASSSSSLGAVDVTERSAGMALALGDFVGIEKLFTQERLRSRRPAMGSTPCRAEPYLLEFLDGQFRRWERRTSALKCVQVVLPPTPLFAARCPPHVPFEESSVLN